MPGRHAGTATEAALPLLADRWRALVVAMIAVDAGVFAWLSVARHRAYSSGRFDLGNMVQAVWSSAHGHALSTTDVSGAQFVRLGAHVDPVLLLFVPLWWLWSSAEMLLVAQAAIVALGALPAFWLGRRWLHDDRLAAAGAALYLLYPPLQYATLFDFHPVTLAAPLLLFCLWAAEEARVVPLAVCGGLACLTQEQVGLAVAATAVWLAVRHPDSRRAAALIGGASLAWVVVALAAIIPHFAVNGGNPQIHRYDALGSGPVGILRTLVTHPWRPVEILGTPHRLAYLAALLLPLLALPLAAPLLAAGALPQLVLNLLASSGPAQSIQFHYAAVVTPFLVAAALLGLARLRVRRRPQVLAPLVDRPRAVAITLVAALVFAGARLGPLPFWQSVPLGFAGTAHDRFTLDPQARAMDRAVALVPPDAAVSASNEAGAHLSERTTIMLFPTIADATWVLVDAPGHALRAEEGRRTLRPLQYRARLAALQASPQWRLVFMEHGVRLFERRRGARAPVVRQR